MPTSDMQQQRNKRQVILFLVLVAGIVLALALKPGRARFEVPADFYRGFNLREVDRVEMKSPITQVTLAFRNNRWQVNGGHFADRSLTEVLFATMQQAEPKRTVASSLKDSLARELKNNGVKVSLYAGDDRLTTFFAGGNAAKTQAYFVKEDSDEPHLMTIPGYRVYVSGIFELSAIQWYEKLIFDFNWTNFRSLETTFRNPAGNFMVEMARTGAAIRGIAEADTARLNTFLDDLSLLRAEEYLPESAVPDSLRKSAPLATFQITDIGGRVYFLRIHDLHGRFIGITHSGQFAVLPRDGLIPLLRPKDFFVKR